jgi:hypothetical protein
VPSLHLAVAPVGSVLVAVAVGADFEADDLAAPGVPVAGAVAAGAASEGSGAGVLFDAFCTPPWPLHAPRPVAMEVVPSLQVLGAPEVAGAAGAADAAAAGADRVAAAFWTPPWPLHAPRPVAVEVVPSLQVVGAPESAARADRPKANTIKDPARSPANRVFFMKGYSPGVIRFTANCRRIGVKTNLDPRLSVPGVEGQYRVHLHHKRCVLVPGARLKQYAIDADM